jgi:hypothetical protein
MLGLTRTGRRYLGTWALAGLDLVVVQMLGRRSGGCWRQHYVLVQLEEGRHLLMMIFNHLHSTSSHDSKRTGESSPRALLFRDITHHRTQPLSASLHNRGASQQQSDRQRLPSRAYKSIAVSTSAVSRGQTSMKSWLSRPWTGIFQYAALLPLRTALCAP